MRTRARKLTRPNSPANQLVRGTGKEPGTSFKPCGYKVTWLPQLKASRQQLPSNVPRTCFPLSMQIFSVSFVYESKEQFYT